MHLLGSKIVLTLAISSSFTLLSAATPGIGIAMSQGNVLINSASTAGNATIFDGNTLETQSATSRVRLTDGAELRLAADSRGTVFSDHVDLEKGNARIAAIRRTQKNRAYARKAFRRTLMRSEGIVQIAALTGNVHILMPRA